MEAIFDGYNFNESLKQFEPLDSNCVYCRKNKSTSFQTNKYLKLYKERDRTNLIVYRSVKYNQFTVLIPRCSKCTKAHGDASFYSGIFTWVSFFLMLPFGYYFIGGVTGMFVSLISSFLIAVYIKTYSERKILLIKGIDSEGIGAERVKLVRDFLNDNWVGVPPSA